MFFFLHLINFLGKHYFCIRVLNPFTLEFFLFLLIVKNIFGNQNNTGNVLILAWAKGALKGKQSQWLSQLQKSKQFYECQIWQRPRWVPDGDQWHPMVVQSVRWAWSSSSWLFILLPHYPYCNYTSPLSKSMEPFPAIWFLVIQHGLQLKLQTHYLLHQQTKTGHMLNKEAWPASNTPNPSTFPSQNPINRDKLMHLNFTFTIFQSIHLMHTTVRETTLESLSGKIGGSWKVTLAGILSNYRKSQEIT